MMIEGLEPQMLENKNKPFTKEKKVYKELQDITAAALSLIQGLATKPKDADPNDLTEMKTLFELIKTSLFPATQKYFTKGS